MTRIEYDLLRRDRKELDLPRFEVLVSADRERVSLWIVSELIATRTAWLLSQEVGETARIRYDPQEMESPAKATA